jgi:hypothetical protein
MGVVAAPKIYIPINLEYSTCGGSAKQYIYLCQSRFVFGQLTRCRYHARQKPFSSRLWLWLDEFEFGRTRDDGQRQPYPHSFQPIFIPICVSKRIPSVSTAVFFRLGNSTTGSSTQEGQAIDILWKNIDRSWTPVANSMRRYRQRPKDCRRPDIKDCHVLGQYRSSVGISSGMVESPPLVVLG